MADRPTKPLAPRAVEAWGGFVDGRLHFLEADTDFGGRALRKMPAIFKRRECARAEFEDVRRVRIVPVPIKPRRTKPRD